jgi:hypothetical protein
MVPVYVCAWKYVFEDRAILHSLELRALLLTHWHTISSETSERMATNPKALRIVSLPSHSESKSL